MNGRMITRLLPLACVTIALAVTQPLDAQFGGFGRRITEGVKKAAGTEEETPKPAAPKPVTPPVNERRNLPINAVVINALIRSLETEIALKEELFQELDAREAAVEKHEACKAQVAGSPEAVEILMQLGNMPDNATNEQLTQMMAKMATEQEALVLKMCGAVPAPINTADRLREIDQKAAAASGPVR